MIEASVATMQIPRFTLQGFLVSKSVRMTNTLEQIVGEFSKEKNILQREVFEVALIDFFKKCGYKREVDTFLEQYG